ncbi:hypothetical protein [Bacterioplanoides sp.]|uniref:hypothetical protein n=1 Tax=Bacterioplanoides sp. TaxID=2066072 RepID=UPI003AFFD14B
MNWFVGICLALISTAATSYWLFDLTNAEHGIGLAIGAAVAGALLEAAKFNFTFYTRESAAAAGLQVALLCISVWASFSFLSTAFSGKVETLYDTEVKLQDSINQIALRNAEGFTQIDHLTKSEQALIEARNGLQNAQKLRENRQKFVENSENSFDSLVNSVMFFVVSVLIDIVSITALRLAVTEFDSQHEYSDESEEFNEPSGLTDLERVREAVASGAISPTNKEVRQLLKVGHPKAKSILAELEL